MNSTSKSPNEDSAPGRVVLCVGGWDPSAGAGLAMDLRTVEALGAVGLGVVSSIVIENSRTVRGSLPVEAEDLIGQVDVLLEEFRPDAVKVGLVANPSQWDALGALRDRLGSCPWVVDPVIASGDGSLLAEAPLTPVQLRDRLADMGCITPNGEEAARLAGETKPGDRAGWERLALGLAGDGESAVLVTGGHFEGDFNHCDLLAHRGAVEWIESPEKPLRADRDFHGTGCMFASALATRLAQGESLPDAARYAKGWVVRRLNGQPDGNVAGSGRRIE